MISSLTDPPSGGEVEVSLFGPGKGESCVVHLGNDDWIIVDSCIDQRTGENAALAYLSTIGVDPSVAVRLVVGTHAHDDHIAGIAEVFEACSKSSFVSSSALVKEEFASLLEVDAALQLHVRQSSYSEYRRLRAITRDRGVVAGTACWKRASEQRTLWERPASLTISSARVVSVSPSDQAVTRSLIALGKSFPQGSTPRQHPAIDPNELSVALWIDVGQQSMLLGADLLRGPAGCGWQAVLATHRPDKRASLFKVPHHGAPNAHHEQVFEDLLADKPVAILAPYRAGKTRRPSGDDVRRLCALTSATFATADSQAPPKSRQQRLAAATLSSLAKNVRDPWGTVGHIRARSTDAGSFRVQVSGHARDLCG